MVAIYKTFLITIVLQFLNFLEFWISVILDLTDFQKSGKLEACHYLLHYTDLSIAKSILAP